MSEQDRRGIAAFRCAYREMECPSNPVLCRAAGRASPDCGAFWRVRAEVTEKALAATRVRVEVAEARVKALVTAGLVLKGTVARLRSFLRSGESLDRADEDLIDTDIAIWDAAKGDSNE